MDEFSANFFAKHPLAYFSTYTEIQVNILDRLANEIRHSLKAMRLADGGIDGTLFNECYGKFWLWVIGAYEVVRTMVDAKRNKKRWSEITYKELESLKSALADLRIPFAKQEYRASNLPIKAEASVTGINDKDFSFTVNGKHIHVLKLLEHFDNTVKSISITSYTL